MQIYDKLENLKLNNTAVALGLFDGLHRGHIKIIDELVLHKKNNYQSCIFTFSIDNCKPNSKGNLDILVSNRLRNKILESKGINTIVSPPFEKISMMSPLEFIENILIYKLDAKFIVCGQDYKFGYKAQGDVNKLKEVLEKNKIELHIVKNLKYLNKKISSSQIRELIRNGNVRTANKLLGYNFCIDSPIVKFDLTNKILIQKIPIEYVWPLKGSYKSMIICNNILCRSETTIFHDRQCAWAATIYEEPIEIIEDLEIQLIRKL